MVKDIQRVGASLLDPKEPISKKMSAVFVLKHANTSEALRLLNEGFASDSVLLKHEIAYVMGQTRNKEAVPYLNTVLADVNRHPVVRHEAAEALAAIGEPESVEILQQFANDAMPEVSETCTLALDTMKWRQENKKWSEVDSEFHSVDPAPPAAAKSVPDLRAALLDTSKSFFDRYRALFGLREIGDEEATKAITEGFSDKSALFRHEIAYVLGQVRHEAAVSSLIERLRDVNEHSMVRHEAAEALGSIASDSTESLLKEFQSDPEPVVSESCDVALDLAEYWTSQEINSDDEVEVKE